MKLSQILLNRIFIGKPNKIHLYKIPTWLKPGDLVRDISGLSIANIQKVFGFYNDSRGTV